MLEDDLLLGFFDAHPQAGCSYDRLYVESKIMGTGTLADDLLLGFQNREDNE